MWRNKIFRLISFSQDPFDYFLVQKTNEIYQGRFSKKFTLDEHGEKAFPTLSKSVKGVVSNSFLGACPPDPLFLISLQFSDYLSSTFHLYKRNCVWFDNANF